jgi:putative DNA primase/helicase
MSTLPDYEAIFDEAQRAASEQAHLGPVLRCFSDIESEVLRWLWPGRIPLGKLTLLIGDPGLGKSLVTVDIASRVTRGASFLDGAECQMGQALFLSAEDDASDTIRPRLDAAGADVSRVHTLDAVRVLLTDGSTRERVFSLETDTAHLESALGRYPNIRLVVIDPLSAYLGGADSHSNAEIRGLLSPLTVMAARRNVAVLGVTHLRKSPGNAVHRAIGSIAFAAAARAGWAVAPDPADSERRLFLAVKQNLSAPASGMAFRVIASGRTARVEWEGGVVNLTANEVLGGTEGQEGHSEKQEAIEWLKELLADGPVAAKKVRSGAEEAGLSWATVRRAKDALGVKPQKSTFNGGWDWRLDHAHREDVQPIPSQMSAFEQPIETSGFNGSSGVEDAQRANVSSLPSFSVEGKYVPDNDGAGCTCQDCAGHFATVAGWRAHIARCRCEQGRPNNGRLATPLKCAFVGESKCESKDQTPKDMRPNAVA